MKKLILLFLLILFGLHVAPEVKGQAAGWAWTKQYGGPLQDYSIAIDRDAQGNFYMGGVYIDSTDIGPYHVVSPGWYNAYLVKLDSAGNILWLKEFSSPGLSMIYNVKTHASGHVFVSGIFSDTLTIGGLQLNGITPQVSPFSQGQRAFIAKLDANGQELWVKGSLSTEPLTTQQAQGLAVDPQGNSYITGDITGTALFGNFTLVGDTSAAWGYHHFNGFVVKYDPSGNEVWATGLIGEGYITPNDIVADNNGNVYITGDFQPVNSTNSLVIGPNTLVTSGGPDILLAKLNSSGGIEWAKRAGSYHLDEGYAIAVDSLSNIYITGVFWANADFDTDTLYANDQGNSFIASYTSAGALRWAKQVHGNSMAVAISVDAQGNSFIAGVYTDTITVGTQTLISSGWIDVLVAKFNPSGVAEWAVTSQADSMYSGAMAWSVIQDGAGNCYTMGNFYRTVEFGLDSLTSAGNTHEDDIFISRVGIGPFLRIANPGFSQTTAGAAVNIPYRTDGTFNSGNTFTVQLSDANGSFASPTAIGSITSTTAGQISAVIPANTPVGDHYRIRVTASAPAKTSPDNGADIRIGLTPVTPVMPPAQLTVHPNPFSNSMALSGLQESMPAQVELIDMLGRTVFSRSYSAEEVKQQLQIETSANIYTGIYLLQVLQGDSCHQLKIIKQ